MWPRASADPAARLGGNALVHRDYSVSAPVRLLIFADRVEIISPGHSNLRKPALASPRIGQRHSPRHRGQAYRTDQ